MPNIEYKNLDQVNLDDLLQLLNQDSLRAHLIDHPYFDQASIQLWIKEKIAIDKTQGCKVRAVLIDKQLAGWCGIQRDDQGYEIAIVIGQVYWGAGLKIFQTVMQWAKELGHEEVIFHLLETRREYKALAKMASKVHTTNLLGRSFTTYHLTVANTLGRK